MNQQNNQTNKNFSSFNQHKEELKIFQDPQSNQKYMQDGFTQTEDWFSRICGVQNILTLEHAQACQKFKDFLKDQEKNNNQIKQQELQISQLSKQIEEKTQNIQSQNQYQQQNSIPKFACKGCFHKVEKEEEKKKGFGYYFVLGVGAVIAFKLARRIIFGKNCKYPNYQNWKDQMNQNNYQRYSWCHYHHSHK